MAHENKLNLISSADLAREEERISKKALANIDKTPQFTFDEYVEMNIIPSEKAMGAVLAFGSTVFSRRNSVKSSIGVRSIKMTTCSLWNAARLRILKSNIC